MNTIFGGKGKPAIRVGRSASGHHVFANDTEYEALTLTVIAMADALKFDVIAEGVETEVQRRFLAELGCIKG
jgi:EAL domain-containing protein (putative c-di-GMP-specific phosphodiesterase class I)